MYSLVIIVLKHAMTNPNDDSCFLLLQPYGDLECMSATGRPRRGAPTWASISCVPNFSMDRFSIIQWKWLGMTTISWHFLSGYLFSNSRYHSSTIWLAWIIQFHDVIFYRTKQTCA